MSYFSIGTTYFSESHSRCLWKWSITSMWMYIRLIKHLSIFLRNGVRKWKEAQCLSLRHIRQIQEEMQMFARCSGPIVRSTLDIHTKRNSYTRCMFISFLCVQGQTITDSAKCEPSWWTNRKIESMERAVLITNENRKHAIQLLWARKCFSRPASIGLCQTDIVYFLFPTVIRFNWSNVSFRGSTMWKWSAHTQSKPDVNWSSYSIEFASSLLCLFLYSIYKFDAEQR